MFGMKRIPKSKLHQDYLSSFLRSQIMTLQSVLSSVENSEKDYDGYLYEAMGRVELEIRRFKKGLYN